MPELSREVFATAASAEVLPALARRTSWAEAGGMFHVLFNVLFFYDLHVCDAILRTALRHRDGLIETLAAHADLESLCSLACFAWEQPQTCWPRPRTEPGVDIAGGCHPLIAVERVVPNGVTLGGDRRLWIITGSNMAGKSTFLRMVGSNVALAQVGTVALAETMTWSPVRLVTDLRIRDSVNTAESYFLAEVRQMRRMVVPDEHPARVLGLIDEPFRGTNSEERVAASVALVEHLRSSPHFFLLATHEQRLTALADDGVAVNYHFREDLDAGGEVFDYRLRSGPATIRNALRVMEREGYPDSLLRVARAWIDGDRGD